MAVDRPTGSEASPAVEVPSDILARINEREREIERVLLEAHETAATTLREAKARAEAISSARREEAEREAALAAEVILAAARNEAQEILAAGSRGAAEILRMPRERVEEAARRLLVLVLPGAPREEAEP
jgi:vacuolar-type H+-ATPase subunit H